MENASDLFGNADLDQLSSKEHRMADATDFESMTRAELVELRGKLDKAIVAAGDRDRQRALKAAEDLAREHGFSLAELTGGGSGKGRGTGGKRSGRSAAASSAPSDAKYRSPDNAEQTWSGRGRRPGWVNEALANGRALTDLAI